MRFYLPRAYLFMKALVKPPLYLSDFLTFQRIHRVRLRAGDIQLTLTFIPFVKNYRQLHHIMSGLLNPKQEELVSGQLTPNGIAEQLSKLDFPAPDGFSFPSKSSVQTNFQTQDQPHKPAPISTGSRGHARTRSNADDVANQLSSMSFPEPERINQTALHKRTESASEQLSAKLAGMNFAAPERMQDADRYRRDSTSEELSAKLARMDFPQPERIFGGADNENSKGGVKAEEWDKVVLDEEFEIPEAVRRGSTVGITSPLSAGGPGSANSTGMFGGPPAMGSRGNPRGESSLSQVKEESSSSVHFLVSSFSQNMNLITSRGQ